MPTPAGRESWILQRYPVQAGLDCIKEEPKEILMQDLAGNAMALPTLLAALMSSMSALPWKDRAVSSVP
eukprot:9627020-Prorocentrum_lima.AAC.1